MPRWLLLTAAAAVVVVGVSWAALSTPERVTAEPSQPIGTESKPHLVILGDSYTSGTPLGGAGGTGWPLAVQDHFGWILTIDAGGGSGYLRAGPTSRPFDERVADVIAQDPDILIVAGGINDARHYPTSEITDAATEQWKSLREGAPDAQIVIVGPFYPTSPAPRQWRDLDSALREAATSLGLDYVDALPWFTGDGVDIGADGTHPTDEGHAQLAKHIIASLEELGLQPAA